MISWGLYDLIRKGLDYIYIFVFGLIFYFLFFVFIDTHNETGLFSKGYRGTWIPHCIPGYTEKGMGV